MLYSPCMRAGLVACLFAFVAWAPLALSKARPSGETVRELSALVSRAIDSNPSIQASRAAVDAAKARLTGAGLPLFNPELEMEAERTDIDTVRLGVRQTVDWHDKKGALQQVARTELAAAEARLDALRLSKAGELLDAVGRVVTRRQISALSKRRATLLERFARLAKRRYAAGDISLAELQLARLSLAEAVMRHASDAATLIEANSDFFALSGQTLDARIEIPESLPASLSASDNETLARHHPRIQVAQRMAQAARQRIQAVARQRKADPTFGLAAGRDGNENLLALSFSMPLQVRNRFLNDVDAARADALQAERQAQQTYRNLLAALQGAQARYRVAARAWSRWIAEGRVSLRKRLGLLETLWKSGEINTTDYLFQVQQTLDTRIAAVELHGKLWSAWIEWLRASATLTPWLNTAGKEL